MKSNKKTVSDSDGLNISSEPNEVKNDTECENKAWSAADMTEGPFLKKMILFAIPLILTGFLQSFYNAADLIVVNLFSQSDAPLVGAIGCSRTEQAGIFADRGNVGAVFGNFTTKDIRRQKIHIVAVVVRRDTGTGYRIEIFVIH